jgi:hypothetical protein
MGIAKTTTLCASGITLVTGKGGLQGGIDSIAATPTSAAPLAIAAALISLVNSCDENSALMGNILILKFSQIQTSVRLQYDYTKYRPNYF